MISINSNAKKEIEYRKYLFNEDIGLIRQMLIMSLILYSSFGIVDRLLEVANIDVFTIIRFYIIAPLVVIIFIFSYHKLFYIMYQYVLTIMYVLAGIGIVVMLTLAPEVSSYYGGLFLVFGYGYFLIRINWEFATIGSIVILIVYFILAFIHLEDYINDVLIYSVFYITFIIIAVSGSYTFTKYRKERYLQETHLKGDNIVLEKQIYENLKEIVVSVLKPKSQQKQPFF